MTFEAPEGWTTHKLIDVAEYINGRATKPAEGQDTGMLLVRIRELTSGIGQSSMYIDPSTVKAKHLICDGDLLFAWSASVGIYVWRGPDAALNQHIFKVVAKPGVDQRFLRYLLTYELVALTAAADERRTTMGHVRKADLERLDCFLPPLDEQRAIAEVLGSLDDRLDHLVDRQQHIRAVLHALYQDISKDGGQATTMADVVQTTTGRSYKSAELSDSSTTGLANLKNIPRFGGFDPAGIKGYTGPFKAEQRVTRGDLVVACTDMTQQGDVVGRVGRVQPRPDFDELVASMDLIIVRPAVDWMSREYLYEVLSTPEYVQHAKSYANGTTVLHMKKAAVPDYKFECADPEQVAAFTKAAQPLWALYDAAVDETLTVRALRDALLPKLVSGEVRVDADALLELAS